VVPPLTLIAGAYGIHMSGASGQCTCSIDLLILHLSLGVALRSHPAANKICQRIFIQKAAEITKRAQIELFWVA
jgi:hypothetical protein